MERLLRCKQSRFFIPRQPYLHGSFRLLQRGESPFFGHLHLEILSLFSLLYMVMLFFMAVVRRPLEWKVNLMNILMCACVFLFSKKEKILVAFLPYGSMLVPLNLDYA